jgi:hypothetical protein
MLLSLSLQILNRFTIFFSQSEHKVCTLDFAEQNIDPLKTEGILRKFQKVIQLTEK